MSAESNHRRRHVQLRWMIVAAAMLLLPVVYVLSIGPAAWLNTNGYLPDSIRQFYTPVIWLHDGTPLKEPLEWYLALWGVR